MIVYPDTSFLFALWQEDDANHAAAQKFFQKHDAATWLWCDLHEIEVPIAAQVATHRQPVALAPHLARQIVFRAERAARRGFLRRELPAGAKKFALALAAQFGWEKRLTAFDLWHLGAAFELGCDTFATFDTRQAAVARTAQFRTNPA